MFLKASLEFLYIINITRRLAYIHVYSEAILYILIITPDVNIVLNLTE